MGALVVDGPHAIWADVGGGGRWDVGAIAASGAVALSYKISEGRGYIDAAGQYHHDQAMEHNLLPIPYVFPLPATCGMSITDQAARDAALIHSQHGSFEGIGAMLDCEYEPGVSGWGPFLISSSDVALYVSTLRSLTGMRIGGYTGWKYVVNGREGFDWRVVPSYSYGGGAVPAASVDDILRRLNGGVEVAYMPPGGAFRQFTDAANMSGRKTDFNIAPIPPAQFLEVVGGSQEDTVSPADIKAIADAVNAHTNQAVLVAVGAAVGQEQNPDGSFPYTIKGLKLQTDNQQAALNKSFAALPESITAAVVAHIPAAGGLDEADLEAAISKVVREQLANLQIGLKA